MSDNGQKATKDRILDAAEERFAEEGFGTSLRSITSHAGVNLAAIHYHFGSKEALIEALFRRRIEPLNKVRFEMLDELESSPETSRSLEKIVTQDPRLHFRPENWEQFLSGYFEAAKSA